MGNQPLKIGLFARPFSIFCRKIEIQKFLKKGVAFDIPLCYNNFCPLEKAAQNRRNKRFSKNFLKSLKKLLTDDSQRDILSELRQTEATNKHLDK